jgi:hypothetical protein
MIVVHVCSGEKMFCRLSATESCVLFGGDNPSRGLGDPRL